jgi:hypothetical protein
MGRPCRYSQGCFGGGRGVLLPSDLKQLKSSLRSIAVNREIKAKPGPVAMVNRKTANLVNVLLTTILCDDRIWRPDAMKNPSSREEGFVSQCSADGVWFKSARR